MTPNRTKSWKILFDAEVPFQWPPFLVDLALNFDFEDPAELFENSEFLDQARTAASVASARMPDNFVWSQGNLKKFCESGAHSGFEYYINRTSRWICNILTRDQTDTRRLGISPEAWEDSRSEYRQILRATVVRRVNDYDPMGGKKTESSGFESYLWMFAVKSAQNAIAKIVFSRYMISLDAPVGTADSDPDYTACSLLEASGAENLITKSNQAQMADFRIGNLESTAMIVEREVLKDSPHASLYLIVVSGAKSVEQASAMLGLTPPTAYRHIQSVCRKIIDLLRERLAEEAGLTILDAREEILGFFLGEYKTDRFYPGKSHQIESLLDLANG